MKFSAFLRALVWVVFGVAFGVISILLILASSIIFKQQDKRIMASNLLDNQFITFLCVALMAGAAADYILSVTFKKERRIIVLLFLVIVSIIACFIFNPALT